LSEEQDIRDCVVFLCSARDQFICTAFLVGVTSEIPNYSFLYLVTAKHVAETLINKPFLVRMNNNKGSCEYISVEATRWYFHPSDKTADVAVLPFTFDKEAIEFKMLPLEMLVSDNIVQTKTIRVGNEVWIPGLFVFATGSQRNQPIVRTGNIAMLPNEPIPTEHGNIEAYLIEARSIGGISGSPVFVYSYRNRMMYLLGMMRGHWAIRSETINAVFPIPDDRGVNLGIAVVSPAKKILETLNQPELVKLRGKAETE